MIESGEHLVGTTLMGLPKINVRYILFDPNSNLNPLSGNELIFRSC